jgi:dihydrofolate reductase
MAKLRVHNFSISLDGYGAGPGQKLADPLGVGGRVVHEWVFATRTGRAMIGAEGGDTGLDDEFIALGEQNIGATVMGRNMFGPVRGPWAADEQWKGWWGDNPPYHHPTFVLTHHARPPVVMAGGTTFHFVTDGLEPALKRAFEAAGGKDVRLGGGVATVQQALRARLIDELHIAIVPALLGAGERLFDNLDRAGTGWPDGYEITQFVASTGAAHARLSKKRS